MRYLHKALIILLTVTISVSCRKDHDPVIVVTPSKGTEKVTLNGIAGTEAGTSAGNSVYLDLSGEKQTPILRSSWDLAFYNGSDFRVILNNTTAAEAKVLDKNDLTLVNKNDTVGLNLTVDQFDPSPSDFSYFDDISGDLTKTVIPEVSATDESNPVVILNRGTGGSIAPRPWIKLRIMQNPAGYTLQYAEVDDPQFKVLNIPKDPDYNFTFVSFDNGIVPGEPEKDRWEIVWTYSVYKFDFGGMFVPFNFSDMIAINYLGGVQVSEKVYDNENLAAAAYDAFNMDSVSKSTFANDKWAIGDTWRSTIPATGARNDRFYIIKDVHGNYYKFKCLAMGAGNPPPDGGVRGKPEFKYDLIAK